MRLLTLPPVAEIEKVPRHEAPVEMARLAALLVALAPRLATPPTVSGPPTGRNYVTAKIVADALSMRTDRIYELARQGRIPCHKVGRAVRFDIDEVRASFAHQPQTTQH